MFISSFGCFSSPRLSSSGLSTFGRRGSVVGGAWPEFLPLRNGSASGAAPVAWGTALPVYRFYWLGCLPEPRGANEAALQGQWRTRQVAKPQGDKTEAQQRVRQSD